MVFSFTGHVQADEQNYRRTLEKYTVPDVVLINQNGTRLRLKELLQSGSPVVVSFIFGSCTTICPVLSANFTNFQQKHEADSQKVRLVSISIDPENDSPKVMKEYLKRYRAKPGWDFLTGSRSDIDAVMRAFDAYIPNKMYHYPLTFLKSPGESGWVRISGLLSSSEFNSEFQRVSSK
jgi:protein SCO1/2